MCSVRSRMHERSGTACRTQAPAIRFQHQSRSLAELLGSECLSGQGFSRTLHSTQHVRHSALTCFMALAACIGKDELKSSAQKSQRLCTPSAEVICASFAFGSCPDTVSSLHGNEYLSISFQFNWQQPVESA